MSRDDIDEPRQEALHLPPPAPRAPDAERRGPIPADPWMVDYSAAAPATAPDPSHRRVRVADLAEHRYRGRRVRLGTDEGEILGIVAVLKPKVRMDGSPGAIASELRLQLRIDGTEHDFPFTFDDHAQFID